MPAPVFVTTRLPPSIEAEFDRVVNSKGSHENGSIRLYDGRYGYPPGRRDLLGVSGQELEDWVAEVISETDYYYNDLILYCDDRTSQDGHFVVSYCDHIEEDGNELAEQLLIWDSFRTTLWEACGVVNKICNNDVDWEDLASRVGEDGVFRGFGDNPQPTNF